MDVQIIQDFKLYKEALIIQGICTMLDKCMYECNISCNGKSLSYDAIKYIIKFKLYNNDAGNDKTLNQNFQLYKDSTPTVKTNNDSILDEKLIEKNVFNQSW